MLLLVFGLPVTTVLAWFLIYNVRLYLTTEADKAKFAKIEVLVNNVKADLEKAFPEKTWEIVKFCDPLKGELGNIISITCEYGVKSENVVAKDLQPYIEKYAQAKRSGDSTLDANTYYGVESAACLSASSYLLGGTSVRANFYCLAETEWLIYPEHDY